MNNREQLIEIAEECGAQLDIDERAIFTRANLEAFAALLASQPSAAPEAKCMGVVACKPGECPTPNLCSASRSLSDAAPSPLPRGVGLTACEILHAAGKHDAADFLQNAAINAALSTAKPAETDPVELTPDYSEMSREALERHATRMAQALADDGPRKFYDRYASGPLMAPSCLCCGKLPNEVAIKHMELPGIVICKACRDAALSTAKPVELTEAVRDVLAERARQDAKWGGPAHDDRHYVSEWRSYIQKQMNWMPDVKDERARSRFVKIAALAVAAIESLDRKATSGYPDGGCDAGT